MADEGPVEARGDALPADSVVSLLKELLGFMSSRGKEDWPSAGARAAPTRAATAAA